MHQVILDHLSHEFRDLFARDPRARVALWFDSKAEFQSLLPYVVDRLREDSLQLLAYAPENEHGALWLKWATEIGPDSGAKVVLWLPADRESLLNPMPDGAYLDCLLEYQYSGLTWLIDGKPPTLFTFLKKHGVPLPTNRAEQDALWRGGPESALAKYTRANLERSQGFWKSRSLTVSVIEESIVGDVQERFLRFLGDPEGELQALESLGIADEFRSQITDTYAVAGKLLQDPTSWARAFVRSMIALDVYETTEHQKDFPFAAELPKEKYHKALTALLERWRRDRDHLETYRRWSQEIDPEMDLRVWARSKPGHPDSLYSLARDRWIVFLKDMQEFSSSEKDLREHITGNKELAKRESKGFWAKTTGDLNGWMLVIELANLIDRVDGAVGTCSGALSAEDVVHAYTQDWHKIDLSHWTLQVAARQEQDMEVLAAAADRFYLKYLKAVGQAFYEAIQSAGSWHPEGCKSVSDLTSKLFKSDGKRKAILMVDALRYDLAAYLRESLSEGELEAYLADVPTETWVGMSSLIPELHAHLRIVGGKIHLDPEESTGDLVQRANRWKLLHAAGANHLGKDLQGNRQDELRHLRALQEAPKELPETLVLFERGVDAIAHQAKEDALRHFEEILEDVKWSIRKLRRLGYQEINVVTDHGFILLHGEANIQPYEIDKAQFQYWGARYALLEESQTTEALTVPFRIDPAWKVALSPGLRSFKSPGRFFHGGATLQEAVIPRLRFVIERPPREMGLSVSIPKSEIATLAVKIELIPETPPPRDLFDTHIEPLRVRLFLGTHDTPKSSEKVIDIEPETHEPISVTLFLNREPPTPLGTEIPIQVLDEASGRNYAAGLIARAVRDLS